jgi:hypothetical protein
VFRLALPAGEAPPDLPAEDGTGAEPMLDGADVEGEP